MGPAARTEKQVTPDSQIRSCAHWYLSAFRLRGLATLTQARISLILESNKLISSTDFERVQVEASSLAVVLRAPRDLRQRMYLLMCLQSSSGLTLTPIAFSPSSGSEEIKDACVFRINPQRCKSLCDELGKGFRSSFDELAR